MRFKSRDESDHLCTFYRLIPRVKKAGMSVSKTGGCPQGMPVTRWSF